MIITTSGSSAARRQQHECRGTTTAGIRGMRTKGRPGVSGSRCRRSVVGRLVIIRGGLRHQVRWPVQPKSDDLSLQAIVCGPRSFHVLPPETVCRTLNFCKRTSLAYGRLGHEFMGIIRREYVPEHPRCASATLTNPSSNGYSSIRKMTAQPALRDLYLSGCFEDCDECRSGGEAQVEMLDAWTAAWELVTCNGNMA